MLFSTPVFLFLFLPVVLGLYFVLPRVGRNGLLLVSSLFFYAFGEGEVVLVMVVSIVANYFFGLWIGRVDRPAQRRVVGWSVAFNLGLLVLFKYTNFLWDNLASILLAAGVELPELRPIHLPIGISFFTFQAMSYTIDVYRREGPIQRNPIHFAVYISLFPQLIAGPIVRYRDIAAQLVSRRVTREGFAYGVRRFVLGLSKKLLLADVVGRVADQIFAIPSADLIAPTAWLGIVCYTLQIYFDFSGYSDMAIGLGRMFGLKFLENFNFPYISRSITEFWRRWHISLSSWFRDYLYIPLGGNRRGTARTYFNLLLVFFLCGLWHGAAWNFVVWGLFHGAFLVVERVGLKTLLDRIGELRRVYVLLVVMVGWVFFRASDLTHAVEYLGALFGLGTGDPARFHAQLYLDPVLYLALFAGAVGSTPLLPRLSRWRDERLALGRDGGLDAALEVAGTALVLGLLVLCAMQMSASTYNPFIYFRF